MTDPEQDLVTRDELNLVCDMIDLLMGAPTGPGNQTALLSARGYEDLRRWADYRTTGLVRPGRPTDVSDLLHREGLL